MRNINKMTDEAFKLLVELEAQITNQTALKNLKKLRNVLNNIFQELAIKTDKLKNVQYILGNLEFIENSFSDLNLIAADINNQELKISEKIQELRTMQSELSSSETKLKDLYKILTLVFSIKGGKVNE